MTVIQFPARDTRPLTVRVSGEVNALLGRYGVSQAELAVWLGLHQTAVSKRLKGQTEWKVREIEGVADAFDVHPAALMGGYATDPNPTPGDGVPIVRARQDSNLQPSDPKVVVAAFGRSRKVATQGIEAA